MVWRQDEGLVFDPADLDVDVTPQAVEEAIRGKRPTRALQLALRLNEPALLRRAVEAVPPGDIALALRAVPTTRLGALLTALAVYLEQSPHLEFVLKWCQVRPPPDRPSQGGWVTGVVFCGVGGRYTHYDDVSLSWGGGTDSGGVFGASEDVGEGRFPAPSPGDASDSEGSDESARGLDPILWRQHVSVTVLDSGPAAQTAGGKGGRRELRIRREGWGLEISLFFLGGGGSCVSGNGIRVQWAAVGLRNAHLLELPLAKFCHFLVVSHEW